MLCKVLLHGLIAIEQCCPDDPSLHLIGFLLWGQVRTELAGIGISVVLGQQEMLYARISHVQLRATHSKVRYTFEAAVSSFQVRNCFMSAAAYLFNVEMIARLLHAGGLSLSHCSKHDCKS